MLLRKLNVCTVGTLYVRSDRNPRSGLNDIVKLNVGLLFRWLFRYSNAVYYIRMKVWEIANRISKPRLRVCIGFTKKRNRRCAFKLRTHEQTSPVPKICQVKSQSLDYMANKVPMDLRGWVADAESPHWFAWPNHKKWAVQPSSKNANFWKKV